MNKDLQKYNHLNYQHPKVDAGDDFIDFLYEGSELSIPDVSVDKAWSTHSTKLKPSKSTTTSFAWIKIAASLLLLAATSAVFYYYTLSKPEQVLALAENSRMSILFPDGSEGTLNDGASFSYPETFGDERRVALTGEAYFDIKKSEKPFVIDMNGVEVKVLGTAFNLITDQKKVRLYVDRGLVAFVKDGVETKVSAGKEAIFNKENNTVEILNSPSTNIMSWRNGDFQFDNTPLQKALADLSEYYEVDFKVGNEALNNCTVSATIEDKSLSQVMKLISSILDVKVVKKGKTVKISGKGC